MQDKLAAFHHLFKISQAYGLSLEAAALSPNISILMKEILATFNLPVTAEHLEILIAFCRAEDCSDAAVNETLTKLADAGTYNQTLLKLAEM